MSSILMSSDVEGFFAATMDEALTSGRVSVSGSTRAYLVSLLAAMASRGLDREALGRPVTLQLQDALSAPLAERFESLRTLGDRTLAVAGLFADHLQAHGVSVGYVSSVGASAYQNARALRRGAHEEADVFGELVAKFRPLVAALGELADGLFTGPADGPEGIVRVYTRWQRTGSARLGRELMTRGLVPMKASRGVQ